MWIERVELFQIRMPLKFIFKTSQTSVNHRETIVVKAADELGNTGYGEVVAFNEPFYTRETLKDSKNFLINRVLPNTVHQEIQHPFDIHKWHDLTYPMAVAGLENALTDLYARSRRQSIMDVVFNEETRNTIYAGIVLGDLDIPVLMQQIDSYRQEGYVRFKIKIKPEDGLSKLRAIRKKHPDIQLLADANRSYGFQQIHELKRLEELDLLCIEEPLAAPDFAAYRKLQEEINTPVCLDESIQTVDDLKRAVRFQACKVVNIKVGRIGGLYYARQMIEFCREQCIHYWIGSMIESGVSKILHVHLASLKDAYVPGDLSQSRRYFVKDIIRPEITVEKGMIEVPKGYGLGVEIDESSLKEFTVDHIQTGDRKRQ